MKTDSIISFIREKIKEQTAQKAAAHKATQVIAIDGRCGAGKTTLAALLSGELGCDVVPMDDFFLQPDQRTKERLGEPGGNVDYERVQKEILLPISLGQTNLSYAPYDCQTQSLKEKRQVTAGELLILEGSYSCHPLLKPYAAITIFMDVDKEEQHRRILARNGAEKWKMFKERWIPLEELYFSKLSIKEQCDLVLSDVAFF